MSVGQESVLRPVLDDSVQNLCISHLEIDRYQRLALADGSCSGYAGRIARRASVATNCFGGRLLDKTQEVEEVRREGTLWSLPQVGRRRAAGGNAARKLTAVADSVRNFLPLGRAQARARGTLSPFWRDLPRGRGGASGGGLPSRTQRQEAGFLSQTSGRPRSHPLARGRHVKIRGRCCSGRRVRRL